MQQSSMYHVTGLAGSLPTGLQDTGARTYPVMGRLALVPLCEVGDVADAELPLCAQEPLLVGHSGPYAVLGIEPRLAARKANSCPAVLSLWPQTGFFSLYM